MIHARACSERRVVTSIAARAIVAGMGSIGVAELLVVGVVGLLVIVAPLAVVLFFVLRKKPGGS